MPREVIRQSSAAATSRCGPEYCMTIQGRAVRIHLAGLLDRAGVQRLARRAAAVLAEPERLVVLDGARLLHCDYRCVPLLVRWSRGLRACGHRLVLANWNGYLNAILAMEDWDGELEGGFRRSLPARLAAGPLRHVQVP